MKPTKITLGTAQLGMKYGINNKIGKPGKNEAFKILDYAYENGIKSFDTAKAYGESEKIIGDWIKINNIKEIYITTKVSSLKDLDLLLEESLNNLKINKIDYLLCHDFNSYYENEKSNYEKIIKFKNKNYIDNFGLSLYEPNEYDLLNNKNIDTLQIPMNIFDQRFLKGNILKDMKQNNIVIFVRSIFLQGLFFMEIEKIPKKLEKIQEYLKVLNSFIIENQISKESLLFNFVNNVKEVDSIIFGVDNVEQLKNNLKCFKENHIKTKDIDFIKEKFSNIDKYLIDPRMW